MKQAKIAIIGAGLSGLYAAYLLEQANITDYVILEARQRLGGRIFSQQGFDLGATWIWPDLNPELMHLIQQLELPYVTQYQQGDLIFEKQRELAPLRIARPWENPMSIRLDGGMQALIQALAMHIAPVKIHQGQQLTQLVDQGHRGIQLTSINDSAVVSQYQVESVLLALPPRLAAQSLTFQPALPIGLDQQWRNTATWMAPHAKYVAVYADAFWKAQGLSGQAISHTGPIGEIHDASTVNGHAALFGFLSVSAQIRQNVSPKALLTHCRAQLAHLFGSAAATPIAEYIQDWSNEAFTASENDWKSPTTDHAIAPPNTSHEPVWQNRVIGIGSEWSVQHSGYLAGAIDAALCGVQHLTQCHDENIYA